MHRDSLGSVQRIEPGAINWMTAGRGIVHSERTPPDLKQKEYVAHGLQLWAALPKAYEETAPEFTHTPATAIPEWSAPGTRVRVLVGNAFGLCSPVTTYCATLYLDVDAQAGGTLVLPPPEDAGFEQAIYSVGEPLQVDGDAVPAFSMAVLAPGTGATIEAPRGARYVVIGGEPLDAPRTIWWNSSRRARSGSSGPKRNGPRSGRARSPVNTNGFHCHDRGEMRQQYSRTAEVERRIFRGRVIHAVSSRRSRCASQHANMRCPHTGLQKFGSQKCNVGTLYSGNRWRARDDGKSMH